MRINEIVSQQLAEGPNDPHIFKAVFMAGSPGAGKTTIANMLFRGTGLKSLNVDQFWQFYQRTGRTGDYERFWELYKAKEGPLVDQKIGLIIDGTGKNPEVMKKLKHSLETQGYETIMVYVEVDLETTIARAKSRADDPNSPDHGRHIDKEFVTTTWNRVNQGRKDLERLFGNSFFAVDNSKNPDVSAVERQIRNWLNKQPANPKAIEWLQQHKDKPIAARPKSQRVRS